MNLIGNAAEMILNRMSSGSNLFQVVVLQLSSWWWCNKRRSNKMFETAI